MNIVVCIKQVPDVDDIKWTKENNLDRSQMLSTLNKCDIWALDWLHKMKNKNPKLNIVALTMGPNQAKDILNYALSKCADRAILLSDKFFAASDTLATSKIISSAIKKYVPDFDIVITGQAAADGDTEQVPVSVATMLDISDITNCIKLFNIDDTGIELEQKIDNKRYRIKSGAPCLVAINSECDEKYPLKINDYIKAQDSEIETYGFSDLGLDRNDVGILGSPTVVNKAFRPEFKKDAVLIENDIAQSIKNMILEVQ